jgi:hypothetical protein
VDFQKQNIKIDIQKMRRRNMENKEKEMEISKYYG